MSCNIGDGYSDISDLDGTRTGLDRTGVSTSKCEASCQDFGPTRGCLFGITATLQQHHEILLLYCTLGWTASSCEARLA